jgi:hypothetical protein
VLLPNHLKDEGGEAEWAGVLAATKREVGAAKKETSTKMEALTTKVDAFEKKMDQELTEIKELLITDISL